MTDHFPTDAASPVPPDSDLSRPADVHDEVEQLREERDYLLTSLRDLDNERAAGEIADDDYRALRDSYTARAAVVLRAIDDEPAPELTGAGSVEAQAGPGMMRRRPVVWVGAVLALAALVGIAVAEWSGERTANQSVSGSLPAGPAQHLALAHRLDNQNKAPEALREYDATLTMDPSNAEALAYRGWLLKRAGLADRALESLDKAIAVDPGYPDAHFFRGMVLYQDRHDPAAAVPEFQTFLADNPPPALVPPVVDVLNRARRDAGLPAG